MSYLICLLRGCDLAFVAVLSMLVGLSAGSVPKKVSDVDRKRIADLEKSEAVLKEEVSKLKVRHDIFLKILLIVQCDIAKSINF